MKRFLEEIGTLQVCSGEKCKVSARISSRSRCTSCRWRRAAPPRWLVSSWWCRPRASSPALPQLLLSPRQTWVLIWVCDCQCWPVLFPLVCWVALSLLVLRSSPPEQTGKEREGMLGGIFMLLWAAWKGGGSTILSGPRHKTLLKNWREAWQSAEWIEIKFLTSTLAIV